MLEALLWRADTCGALHTHQTVLLFAATTSPPEVRYGILFRRLGIFSCSASSYAGLCPASPQVALWYFAAFSKPLFGHSPFGKCVVSMTHNLSFVHTCRHGSSSSSNSNSNMAIMEACSSFSLHTTQRSLSLFTTQHRHRCVYAGKACKSGVLRSSLGIVTQLSFVPNVRLWRGLLVLM